MLIKMRTGLSGPDLLLQPGDEHEFPNDEAIRLINAGFAVPVAGQSIETAVQPPPAETRVGHELQGTSFDPDAAGHELVGRDQAPAEEAPAEPFGGKGDHDGNGKVGGAKRPGKRR